MLGAAIIVNHLTKHIITRAYVFPGGTIAPILDQLELNRIDIFCARHEQGAGYAALAAARLTQKTQVVMVTSGPGVTNIVTPVADAFYDSAPILIITGQVGTSDLRGTLPIRQRGFQEVNAVDILRSITKAQYLVKYTDELPSIMEEAFYISMEGRKGPVHIDLPMDVQRGDVSIDFIANNRERNFSNEVDSSIIEQVANYLVNASRPVIIAGQGSLSGSASQYLRVLSESLQIPVSHSLLGLGAIPTNTELSLGFHGHTGNQYAGLAIHEADLILAIGSRLDVRQTGNLFSEFAPQAKIIRVDIDNNEMQFSRVIADLDINNDAGAFLYALNMYLANTENKIKTAAWLKQIKEWRSAFPLSYKKVDSLMPQAAIEKVDNLTAKQNVIAVSGVGSHQQWVARHFTFDYPKRIWMTSGGHGAMGFDLPAAIGSKLTFSDHKVLCFVGDGSIQINIQELATLTEYALPVIIIVLDNQRLGLVSQFQKINWGSDPCCGKKRNPDFAKIAAAYGIFSRNVSTIDELEVAFNEAISINVPALIHCIIDENEDVTPMLLGGKKMDSMWPYSS